MAKRFLMLFCLILVLSACGAKRLPMTKLPEAAKKKGTQKPYTVNGKRYEPLQSHEWFIQEGIASWYGKDFHGRRTSNGERYDMHGMTAAHKTLPMGVYVKVRNKTNGSETVVRINDRGPFVKGRIIDLSFAAAKELGIDAAGTAPVRIEALGYREGGAGQAGYKAPANYDAGTYTVQVGALTIYENAQRLSEEMKKQQGFSDIQKSWVNGSLFYRVYAGKYSSLNLAEEARERFDEKGYTGSFVVALD